MRDYYFEEAALTLRDNEALDKARNMEVCVNCGQMRDRHRAADNACPLPGSDPLDPREHTFSKASQFVTVRREKKLWPPS